MRTLLRLPAYLFIFFLAGCALPTDPRLAASAPAQASQTPFINAHALIIIRHADIISAQKATMGNATPLTDAGQQRAKDLATTLNDANITHILVTNSIRTQQTAAPLAQAKKITPEIPHDPIDTFAYLAKIAQPTYTILVVDHHTTIPALLTQLGYPNEPPITDASEFDRFYLLLPDPKTQKYQLIRLRYGAPTSR